MPNGGLVPSCFVCKWAKKDSSKPTHSKDINPLIEPVECGQHGFTVWLPASHVCANLTDQNDGGALSAFAESAGLEGEYMYAWLEFSHQTEKNPDIPQYHHECVRLSSFQEYSAWSLEENKSALSRARELKYRELASPNKRQDD